MLHLSTSTGLCYKNHHALEFSFQKLLATLQYDWMGLHFSSLLCFSHQFVNPIRQFIAFEAGSIYIDVLFGLDHHGMLWKLVSNTKQVLWILIASSINESSASLDTLSGPNFLMHFLKLFLKFWKQMCNWISQNCWDYYLISTETLHACQIPLMTIRMIGFYPHYTLQTWTGQYSCLESKILKCCWNVHSF